MVGFSFLGIKVCINYANPLDILAHRYNFAFLAILVFVALRFGKVKLKGKPKKKLIITCGAYVMFMVFQTIGLVYSASIEAAIIRTRCSRSNASTQIGRASCRERV